MLQARGCYVYVFMDWRNVRLKYKFMGVINVRNLADNLQLHQRLRTLCKEQNA